jgi:hypothetical protein
MFGSCVTRLKKSLISSSSAHCIGLSLEFWKMSISGANPGFDCHTALYIVVTPSHSKSLRQELGQFKMTTYGLLHKGGKCCHGSQRYHCIFFTKIKSISFCNWSSLNPPGFFVLQSDNHSVLNSPQVEVTKIQV